MPGSDTTNGDGRNEPERRAEPAVAEAVRSTESYEASGGTVLYDAENPLAWLQADNAVDLEESA